MRKVIVMLLVDDDKAIENGIGTIDYVEKELQPLMKKGIHIENSRVLDDDDVFDVKALSYADEIFNEC